MLGEIGFPVQANSNFVDVKMGGGGGVGEKGGLPSSFYFGRKKNPWLRGWAAQYNTPEVDDPVLPEQSCS